MSEPTKQNKPRKKRSFWGFFIVAILMMIWPLSGPALAVFLLSQCLKDDDE